MGLKLKRAMEIKDRVLGVYLIRLQKEVKEVVRRQKEYCNKIYSNEFYLLNSVTLKNFSSKVRDFSLEIDRLSSSIKEIEIEMELLHNIQNFAEECSGEVE